MYLGTPAAAVPPLVALHAAGFDIALVVTGEDRRRGRGNERTPTAVKAAAEELGLPVSHDLDAVAGRGADLGVVVAFGRLIPVDLLAVLPMVNLHFSLLPRWRGAAPVERAILAGDEQTGVCVMAVEEGLDTGGIYAREVLEVGGDSADMLRDRLVAERSERRAHAEALADSDCPDDIVLCNVCGYDIDGDDPAFACHCSSDDDCPDDIALGVGSEHPER